MSSQQTPSPRDKTDQILAEALRYRDQREQTYRAQALKLYPWICARCGREFSGKKLRELTVHHKDHNHDNNPPDGSNWELLCLYCHDNEHARQQVADMYGEATPGEQREPPSTYRPFANLKDLWQHKT
jgi:HNH endonuclease